MSLATWVLQQIRAALPAEPIFDGPRTGHTFDGVPVAADVRRLIVVHTSGPSHEDITLKPTKDLARARIIVHSFALTRTEVEARQRAVARALKNRVPVDADYEWSPIAHPVSRWDDPDTTLVAPQLHAIDEFVVAGFEK